MLLRIMFDNLNEEKKAYEIKKQQLFDGLIKAVEALWKFKKPDDPFSFDFDLLESMEGREMLEF